jgi:DNA-binding transcriptional ArsR family regulator
MYYLIIQAIIINKKMDKRDCKKFAMLFKMLSDETRLTVLRTLEEGAKTVSDIAKQLQISQPLVSHHLKTLKNSGLVVSCRKGAFIYHALTTSKIIDLLESVEKVGKEIVILSEKMDDEKNFFKHFPMCSKPAIMMKQS